MLLALFALVILITAFFTSVIGFGMGITVSATSTFFMPAKDAIGISSVVFLGVTATRHLQLRKHASLSTAALVVAGGVPGVLLGVYLLSWADPSIVKRVIGGLLLLAVLHRIYESRSGKTRRVGIGKVTMLAMGFVAGIFSGFAHTGGPLVILSLRRAGFNRFALIGTASGVFTVLNALKIPLYYASGVADARLLLTGLAVAPVGVLGIVGGQYLLTRLSERTFERLVYIAFAAIGLKLLAL